MQGVDQGRARKEWRGGMEKDHEQQKTERTRQDMKDGVEKEREENGGTKKDG